MSCTAGIKISLAKKETHREIARKIYLSYNTEIFRNNQDAEFYIKNEISRKFEIPFSSVEIVGSSKTGISFIKEKKFEVGKSDLDIAIICFPLYLKFSEIAHETTKGYTDLSAFPLYKGERKDKQFIAGISKGYINPFFMPNCDFRDLWLEFFNKISSDYYELFKNINGGVYASEYFFEYKQIECIERYATNPEVYDNLM